jgi:hypothetical protein
MKTECGPGRVEKSCAKPDSFVSSHLMRNVPIVSCTKRTGDDDLLNMAVTKQKKKVWGGGGVKNSSLYGWKTVMVEQITSRNIHTNKNRQPTSVSKIKSIPRQNRLLKNWLVTLRQKGGGGENTSAHSAKI